jgi:hypothetical protein
VGIQLHTTAVPSIRAIKVWHQQVRYAVGRVDVLDRGLPGVRGRHLEVSVSVGDGLELMDRLLVKLLSGIVKVCP